MRLLLTGASGFAGETFVTLASGHHEIVCLGRTKPGVEHTNVSFVEVDITDKASVERAASTLGGDFDALVHLAAYVPKEGAADLLADAESVNVQGTTNLLEAFSGRFQKLILGSTVEVYDQTKITSAITSETTVGPVSYYASTKLSSEFIALSFSKKNNVPIIVLRFSVMYGPHDPIARAIPNFIKSALKDEPITIKGGSAKRDYVHVTDVAESILAALNSDGQGVVAIGTGQGVTIEQAARDIIRVSNSSSDITLEEGSGTDIIIDASEATSLIGFTATKHFPDGLEEIVDSYREG